MGEWYDWFSDELKKIAITDRLVHQSVIIQLTGESYRVKDKLPLMEAKSKGKKNKTTSL